MKAGSRSFNSTSPVDLRYRSISHTGPASIYKSADRKPAVSLATFCTRFRRLVETEGITDTNIDEALWMSIEEFKRKHGTRKTTIKIDGQKIDLQNYYDDHQMVERVEYRNFWSRVRSLRERGLLDKDALLHALTIDPASWRTFYGGGRHRSFVYHGEEYPDQSSKHFHGISSFLHTVGRYEDRALIWSRLKAGWALDDALAIPVVLDSYRTGSIYRLTNSKTGAVYVGLTRGTVEQRWAIHLLRASQGSPTKLSKSIREHGAEAFSVDVLESGIDDPSVLPLREIFWVEHLDALGGNGLNMARPGGMGSPRGKPIVYEGEYFPSIEAAACELAARLGIAHHVARDRLQRGKQLPTADKVRRHSRHPDAGTNLFRIWRAIVTRHSDAVVSDWFSDYDKFKADVSPVPADRNIMRMRSSETWGPGNFEWVDTQTKVERTHGKALVVNGVSYPSLKAVAEAHGIGVSTFKHRITHQGMSVDQALSAPLSATSYRKAAQQIVIDGKTFRSKRQAILYIAETRKLTEHQAKYRLEMETVS